MSNLLKEFTIAEMQIIRDNTSLSDEELSLILKRKKHIIKKIRKRLNKFNKKERQPLRNVKKKSWNMICSSCGFKEDIGENRQYHAARVRCLKCGGPMNRKKDL